MGLSFDMIKLHQKLILALEAGGMGIIEFYPQDSVVIFDEAWCQLLGLDYEKIEHNISTIHRLIHPDDLEEARQVMAEFLLSNKSYFESTLRFQHANGAWRWIRFRGKITQKNSQNQVTQVMSLAFDVTDQKNSEIALSHTNQSLEFVMKGGGFGSWDWRLDTGDVTFDERWCEMLGLDHKTVNHSLSTWDELVHPEDKEQAYQDIKAHLEGKTEQYENTHRLRHKNGSWVWILDRGRISERDKAGKPVRFSGTHLDITQSKEIERQLEAAQSMAKMGSWTYSKATGKFKWSHELLKICGKEKHEDVPELETYLEELHPEDRQRWLAAFNNCLRYGAPYRLRYRKKVRGRFIWLEIYCQAVKGEGGEVLSLFATIQDITERVEMEEENQFIIETLDVNVWKVSFQGDIACWDDRFYRRHDWDPKVSEDMKNEIMKSSAKNLKGEFENTMELMDSQGQTRHIGNRGKVIKDENGKVRAIYGMSWDKTASVDLQKTIELERKKAELNLLQSAKMASLGEMAGGVAHEINNPLAIIQAKTEQILRNLERYIKDEEKFKFEMEKIRLTTERIAKIVRGLRSISRDASLDPLSQVCLRDVIDDTAGLCSEKFKNHGVELRISGDLDLYIYCRPSQLSQVLLNLLNNAHDALKDQSDKWIELKVESNTHLVNISVTDAGRGIPEELVKSIMNPFFTTKEVGQGTGLGLSISKSIVEDHGGHLYYDSNAAHTKFVIELPMTH